MSPRARDVRPVADAAAELAVLLAAVLVIVYAFAILAPSPV